MKLNDKKKQTPVEIVAILDRSGSMATIIDDSIGGFNSFLAKQQELPGEANISVVLFDNEYEVIVDDIPVRDAKPVTKDTYFPRGWTALNDAIGKTLNKMFKTNPERAIVCILTDGQENASKEFTTTQVKQLIEQAQGKGWQIVFLAANQDAFATGNALGIARDSTHSYVANSIGTKTAYSALCATTTAYRTDKSN